MKNIEEKYGTETEPSVIGVPYRSGNELKVRPCVIFEAYLKPEKKVKGLHQGLTREQIRFPAQYCPFCGKFIAGEL